jgi:hypothetical protein
MAVQTIKLFALLFATSALYYSKAVELTPSKVLSVYIPVLSLFANST